MPSHVKGWLLGRVINQGYSSAYTQGYYWLRRTSHITHYTRLQQRMLFLQLLGVNCVSYAAYHCIAGTITPCRRLVYHILIRKY